MSRQRAIGGVCQTLISPQIATLCLRWPNVGGVLLKCEMGGFTVATFLIIQVPSTLPGVWLLGRLAQCETGSESDPER